MSWFRKPSIGIAFLLYGFLTRPVNAGNTTCASTQLDWYTDMVGESPCVTYQRLRQICNIDYQVPNFKSSVPGDFCDDQLSECCCNTVAFQLSMLCMNCQWDTQPGNIIGYEAPAVGTYTVYQNKCGAGTNNSLPTDIQSAVCNTNIKLANFLYEGWTDSGQWFYIYTREHAGVENAQANNNIFTHCPNQIVNASSPGTTSTPNETFTTSSLSTNTLVPGGDVKHTKNHIGPIVGGAVGAVALFALIGGLLVLWRRRQRQGIWDPTAHQSPSSMEERRPLSPAATAPFAPGLLSAGTSPVRSPPAYGSWPPSDSSVLAATNSSSSSTIQLDPRSTSGKTRTANDTELELIWS